MKDFKVIYDDKEDILYIAKEGKEEEVVELRSQQFITSQLYV